MLDIVHEWEHFAGRIGVPTEIQGAGVISLIKASLKEPANPPRSLYVGITA